MATCRDIVRRAMLRLGVLDASQDPSGNDARDGLAALNEMMAGLRHDGIDTLHSDFALGDTFQFFVPPKLSFGSDIRLRETRMAEALHNLSDQGGWDAAANSPTLASATGTVGQAYQVTTAGTTTLDAVTSWEAGRYAMFDGFEWLKSQDSSGLNGGISAMLAMRIADEYGSQVPAVVAVDAENGRRALEAAWLVPAATDSDPALIYLPGSRRRWY